MPARTIRASEIGAYLYCKRAWSYQRQGVESENQAELLSGSQIHQRHGQTVIASGCLRWLAVALMLFALALLTAYLAGQVT